MLKRLESGLADRIDLWGSSGFFRWQAFVEAGRFFTLVTVDVANGTINDLINSCIALENKEICFGQTEIVANCQIWIFNSSLWKSNKIFTFNNIFSTLHTENQHNWTEFSNFMLHINFMLKLAICYETPIHSHESSQVNKKSRILLTRHSLFSSRRKFNQWRLCKSKKNFLCNWRIYEADIKSISIWDTTDFNYVTTVQFTSQLRKTIAQFHVYKNQTSSSERRYTHILSVCKYERKRKIIESAQRSHIIQRSHLVDDFCYSFASLIKIIFYCSSLKHNGRQKSAKSQSRFAGRAR